MGGREGEALIRQWLRPRTVSGEHAVEAVLHARDGTHHLVAPTAELAVGVDGCDPSNGGSSLDVCERIEPLGLENQVFFRFALQPNHKVGHVVVRLAVVHVWNREAQTGVLRER